MSETVKLIIEIPKEEYEFIKSSFSAQYKHAYSKMILNGIPLDDVKAEIEQNAYPIVHGVNNHEKGMTLYGILQVLDNIGKAKSEDKE